MNIRAISRHIGIALIFDALFMAFSLIVSICDDFDSSLSPLLLSCVLTFTTGLFPVIFVRRSEGEINSKEGVVIIVAAWILSCIFGMMPYALWGGEFSLANSWFESVSGFTTTGATILTDIEALPKGLLFWRSSTHFIGGLGVVLFIMMILPSIGTVRMKISKMDMADVSKKHYNFKSNQYLKVVAGVYISLAITSFVAYMLAGMSAFDAINHAFSTVATGGFSTKNASIAAFNSWAVELVAIVFMILSSMHFGLLYTSIVNWSDDIFKDPIANFYLITIVVSTIFVGINLVSTGMADGFGKGLWMALFNVVSYVSSTGFANTDTSVWPLFSILVLSYLSIQCGCSGSTTGGIRADRVWILVKAARTQMLRTIHPNAVIPVKYGKDVADSSLVGSVSVYVIVYIFIFYIFSLAYSLYGLNVAECISSSLSMVGNIGPAFGSLGSLSNFSALAGGCKFLMGVEMIMGRLGLYSILILLVFRKRG
ncbi:MAG: TrkH family potassium uptake protein [Bacteroidales bacterium]|nr:TrkH family potassium uptake protein [Bacteroidales bacterium]